MKHKAQSRDTELLTEQARFKRCVCFKVNFVKLCDV